MQNKLKDGYQAMDEVRELNQKTIKPTAKIFLVLWIGIVVSVYIVIYWPPVLWQVAEGLGITGLIWDLKLLLEPFFTAPYGTG